MKTAGAIFLLAVLALSSSAAGQTSGKGERKLSPEENALRRLETELSEAVVKGDVESVELKLTVTLSSPAPTARRATRHSFSRALRSAGLPECSP